MKLSNPFSRRWLLPTLFVIAGVFVLVKLGLWQLDRLDQRRAFNAYVVSRWDQEPFDLSENSLPADLAELEYRRVQLEGDLDYENQVVLKNQNRNGAPGVNLVTPLLLDENRAILIARGWVPLSESTPDRWSQFEAPTDTPIVGMLQESQILPGAKPPDAPQTEWFRIDIDAIQRQLPYELLPVFVWQLPEPGRSYSALPYREVPFEITEGNHFSYAIQWFMFAAILGFGYFPYMSYFDARRQRVASMPDLGAPAQPMPDAVGHNG
ncbi:MAG: SURF1 family protein, partial [Caldilineaceae bacterium]|nr:SURF1 family protein [Caldilineaceae bacterium]